MTKTARKRTKKSDIQAMIDSMTLEKVSPSSLVLWEENPRIHGNIENLMAAMSYYGVMAPILAQRGTRRVIAGHRRVKAALKKKLELVPVIFFDLNDQDATGYTIADNAVAEQSEWDFSKLTPLLDSLSIGKFDMDMTGLDEDIWGPESEGDKPEKIEIAEQYLNECWKSVAEEWSLYLKSERLYLSPNVTPGIAALLFVRAKYYGEHYPGWCSLAFCPERFFSSGNKRSIPELLEEAEKAVRGLRFTLHENPRFETLLSGGLPANSSRLPLDFPAKLAKDLIDEFTPDGGSVLDPCHGWGGRYVGFLLSEKAKHYQGYDPSPDAHNGLTLTKQTLSKYVDHKTATFIDKPFEDVSIRRQFDFALTSPPYYDVEKYEGAESSWTRYTNFEAWCEGFYGPLLEKVMKSLKPGGHFALQIGSQSYPLDTKAMEYAEACGLKYIERRSAGMSNGHDTPEEKGESILIFRKKPNKK